MTRACFDGAPLDRENAAPEPSIHFEETVHATGRLNAEHQANATHHQLIVGRLTTLIGRPIFLFALTGALGAWAVANALAGMLGLRPLDQPPFSILTGAASMTSLYFVLLILTTQRRADHLTSRRESLHMKLAILNGQIGAKTIALLEELRRDMPHVRDRVDTLADGMARPADAHSVFEAIQEARA